MATVETRGVKKYYGDIAAVNGVELAHQRRRVSRAPRPPGCGKTTLLRMIAGFETPSAGQLLIGGEVVNDLPPRARKIAMVFQSYALYPHMTVFKNIAFPLRAQRVAKAAIPQKVEWAAALFGIGHLLHRKPRELSGGERQRVAWPAPWCASRRSFCWTSRCPIWTRNCALRQETSYNNFNAGSALRRSM